MLTDTQKKAARVAMIALYETVLATGSRGAPAGIVFAAMSEHGCTLAQYQAMETAMIEQGVFTKENNLLFAVSEKAVELGLASRG